MIKIIDQLTGGMFDLPNDVKISIELTNPFVSDQGSTSLPLVLPYTDNNLKLMDFPQRYDRADSLNIKKDVIIQAGVYQCRATMCITSLTKKQGINVTFLIDEASFYNTMKGVSMQQAFAGIVRTDYVDTLNSPKQLKWVNHFNKVMCGDEEDDFHVFPVCTGTSEVTFFGNKITAYSFLNCQSFTGLYSIVADGNGVDYRRLNTLDTPALPLGYSVSPFLKLTYVLNRIFTYAGYTLSSSIFSTDSDLSKLVVLNNTADVLINGIIKYDQLVPTCSVIEFLNSICAQFGCFLNINNNNMVVEILFLNDLISLVDSDLTQKVNQEPTLNFEPLKTIKLSGQNSLDKIKSDFKTIQELFDSYPSITSVPYLYSNSNVSSMAEGIYFSQLTCAYYEVKTISGVKRISVLSSDMLNLFDSNSNLEPFEKESSSEFVPMLLAEVTRTYPFPTTNCDPYWIPVPYIGEIRNLNGVNLAVNSGTTSTTDCPIMLCFHVGRATFNSTDVDQPDPWDSSAPRIYNSNLLFFASTHKYNNIGIAWGNHDLVYGGESGLYHKFWYKWDRTIQQAYQELVNSLNLSSFEILNFNMSKPKMINGQPMLPTSLKYEISSSGIKVVESRFRTLKADVSEPTIIHY